MFLPVCRETPLNDYFRGLAWYQSIFLRSKVVANLEEGFDIFKHYNLSSNRMLLISLVWARSPYTVTQKRTSFYQMFS